MSFVYREITDLQKRREEKEGSYIHITSCEERSQRSRNSRRLWKRRGRNNEREEQWSVVERRRRGGGKRKRVGVGVGFEATKVAERIRSDKLRRVKDNRQKKVKRINEVTLPYH
ncbi:hypothetical protein VNO80_19213 [Phaseolus coccineus]|uniref:Uncharacterized protein n=1 Tax=Phaseolus coccineus TaxID=3886 RepID=A0AAN9MFQ0_PHACN